MNKIEWNGDAGREYVNRRAVKFLTRAAITVKREAQSLLSVQGVGKIDKSGAVVPNTGGNAPKVYNAFPSKPGEPPRKQSGELRRSVTYEVDKGELTARVGTNKPYGRYLELGTKRGLAPRPWLRRALAHMASRVNELLGNIEGSIGDA